MHEILIFMNLLYSQNDKYHTRPDRFPQSPPRFATHDAIFFSFKMDSVIETTLLRSYSACNVLNASL
jgi:hypothetical protein